MRLNKILLLAALILAGGCSTASDLASMPEVSIESRSAARKKFIEGRQFLSLRMNSEALGSFRDAIDLDPKNASYYISAGAVCFTEKQFDLAEYYFKSAIELEPRSKGIYRELGRLYMAKSLWKKAISEFKKDLEISGATYPHEVYNWLALSYYQLKQFENAEREWLKAIEINDNAEIRYNLALAYKTRGEEDKALESFKIASRLNKDFTLAHFEAGQIYYKKQILEKLNFFTLFLIKLIK